MVEEDLEIVFFICFILFYGIIMWRIFGVEYLPICFSALFIAIFPSFLFQFKDAYLEIQNPGRNETKVEAYRKEISYVPIVDVNWDIKIIWSVIFFCFLLVVIFTQGIKKTILFLISLFLFVNYLSHFLSFSV